MTAMRTPSPRDLVSFLANAIDAWHEAHRELTVEEILVALETLRYKLTEGLIELEHKP